MKDKILSDEGRRQQTKLREVAEVAEKIGCSLSQLAIGKVFLSLYTLELFHFVGHLVLDNKHKYCCIFIEWMYTKS